MKMKYVKNIVIPNEIGDNNSELFFKSVDVYQPRILGGKPISAGGTNIYAEGENQMIEQGNVVRRVGTDMDEYINYENCQWTEPTYQGMLNAEQLESDGAVFEHPLFSNTDSIYYGVLIPGQVYPYWTIHANYKNIRIERLATNRMIPNQISTNNENSVSQPSTIIEKVAKIDTVGMALTMDLMKLTYGVPPDFSIFKYTVKITKAEDPEFIYDTFDITTGITEDFDSINYSSFDSYGMPNAFEQAFTISLGDMGIPDGQEIQFHLKPNDYRQYDAAGESYIRISGTYFSTVWGNNSYLEENTLTPVSANYWMYGDFVVENNNNNLS